MGCPRHGNRSRTRISKENLGGGTPKIDREKRTVEVTMPNGTVRVAKQVGSQGCITLPIGSTDAFFKPSIVKSALSDPKTQPWPMGDLMPAGGPPANVDMAKVRE